MTDGGRAGGRAGTDARASFRSARPGRLGSSSIDLSQVGTQCTNGDDDVSSVVSLVMPAASHLSVRDFFLMPSYVVVVVVHVTCHILPSLRVHSSMYIRFEYLN